MVLLSIFIFNQVHSSIREPSTRGAVSRQIDQVNMYRGKLQTRICRGFNPVVPLTQHSLDAVESKIYRQMAGRISAVLFKH
jgi:hypothetical protein